jgi:RNA-directed DNA polymerase
MGRKRRNNQLELAFMTEGRGETPTAVIEGTELPMAKHDIESPASTEHLMEEVCQRENLKEALKRVRANKGSPGVDGMTVNELPDYLMDHWPMIRD